MNYWKLGCRWGKKTEGKPLFYDLLIKYGIVIGWEDKDYGKNANVLLTDGHTSLGVAKTLGLRKSVLSFPEFEEEFDNLQIDYSQHLYVYDAFILTLNEDQRFKFETQVGICRINLHEIQKKMDQTFANNKQKLMEHIQKNNYIDLLEYKKQIILQGPPGTGKTRLAEQIAFDILSGNKIDAFDQTLTEEIIRKYINTGVKFPSAKDFVNYEVDKLTPTGVSIIASTGKAYVPLFKEIIYAYDNKVWEKEGAITKGNDSYSAAIAKYIHFEQKKNQASNHADYLKLVQFHPSYTYEDFVRGIKVKPNEDGDGVLYEAENKIIGEFAQKAHDNYTKSQKQNIPISNLKDNLQRYIDHVISSLDESSDKKYAISDAIHIWYVDEKRFKYKGEDWKGHPNGLNMNFEQLEKILENDLTERHEINKFKLLNSLTRSHATYYANVVAKYKEFIEKNPPQAIPDEPLKKYVLVIDEINRANLSAVLGELIYALEYRDKEVESMYKVDNTNKLTLPSNLYIIGTMNTADRSVGHIDYAIRRRFAFVDVLPKELNDDNKIIFRKDWFKIISELFIENYDLYINDEKTILRPAKTLSSEFRPEDVWLGHSYFIQKKIKDSNGLDPEDFRIRIDFEIKPILLEYVKDGVLVGEVDEMKIDDYIKSL
nr:AAA family ATPase [Pedobacter kyonggii]